MDCDEEVTKMYQLLRLYTVGQGVAMNRTLRNMWKGTVMVYFKTLRKIGAYLTEKTAM
jgi:hypothetical protein